MTLFSFNGTLISFTMTTICSYFIEVIVIILLKTMHILSFSIRTTLKFSTTSKIDNMLRSIFLKRHTNFHVPCKCISWKLMLSCTIVLATGYFIIECSCFQTHSFLIAWLDMARHPNNLKTFLLISKQAEPRFDWGPWSIKISYQPFLLCRILTCRT